MLPVSSVLCKYLRQVDLALNDVQDRDVAVRGGGQVRRAREQRANHHVLRLQQPRITSITLVLRGFCFAKPPPAPEAAAVFGSRPQLPPDRTESTSNKVSLA